MHLRIVFAIIIVTFISSSAFSASDPDSILGSWFTKDNKSKVKIYKCGSKYCGKIVWLKEPKYKAGDKDAGQNKRDRNNPNPAKRFNPILGLKLLWGFNFEDGAWENGRIYDPENGKTYKCIIKLDGNILKVRGYIGFSLIGRTTKWVKAD